MADDFKYDIKQLGDGEVEVNVDVTPSKYLSVKEHIFGHLKENVKIPGFRPGMAPKAKVEEKLGMTLVQETLEEVLEEVELAIIEKEDLKPITRPEISIKEFGDDKGVKFSFTFISYPEVKLGDLAKIKVTKDEAKVTDEDVDKVVANLFADQYHEAHKDEPKKEAKQDKADKKEDDNFLKKLNEWVTDEQVKKIDLDGIKTVKELREKIVEQLTAVKAREVEEKYREDLIQSAVSLSEFSIPKKLVEGDVQKMEEDYKHRISELKVDLDTFLKAQNTSIEKLRENWSKDSENRISYELVLSEVARKYELIPTLEDIDKEIASITDEKTKQELSTPSGRRYVASIMVQRKGVQKLVELAEANNK